MALNQFYSLILFVLLSKLTTSGSSTNQKQKDSYPKLQSQLLALVQEIKHNNETFSDPTDYSDVRVTITSCVFRSCFSYEIEYHRGGALFFVFSASTITKTLFDNCHAFQGGAIDASVSQMTITNTNFTNNEAADAGGAVILFQCANFKITGGFSMYNDANYHGCICVHESNGTIESHNFISNAAEIDCACVSICESQAKIERCYFVLNEANFYPGALQIEEGEGKLITSCIINNCYFIDNFAGGELIHIHISGNVTGSITNCVFDVDLDEAILEFKSPDFKFEHNTIDPNVKTPFESLYENKQEVIKYSKVFDHSKSDYIAGFFIALIPVYVGIVFIILIKD